VRSCIGSRAKQVSPPQQPAIFVMTTKPENLVPLVRLIRGEKVLLDADLANLYGVSTKVLNQGVKRNQDRFPEDFMSVVSG
jgi:hypothetical protein